jgi:glycosyltransferase involved in cell wall biosynthesis
MKVLMICYGYPPIGGAGMIRPVKFAKYLPQFGWRPTVLTPQEGSGKFPCRKDMGELLDVKVVRTPYRDVVVSFKERLNFFRGSKSVDHFAKNGTAATSLVDSNANNKQVNPAKRLVYDMLTMPDEHIGWYSPALDAARELMRKERFDVLYSTSPPETAHLIARSLKSEFGVPWIADLRDLWTLDHYRQRSKWKLFILDKMERLVFRDADALITVSEPWRKDLEKTHGSTKKPILCIPHGFDEDDYLAEPKLDSQQFTLTYTGTIDRDFQDPEILFRVVSKLIQEKLIDRNRFRINFHVYGDNMPDFVLLAKKYDLESVVERGLVLEYSECLSTQQSSTALLVIQWRSDQGKGNPPLKFYDYLGARRPVLIVGTGEGILGEVIQELRAGKVANTEDEIRGTLLNWYKEFSSTGTIEYSGDEVALNRYTRRLQTAKLAEALKQIQQACQ